MASLPVRDPVGDPLLTPQNAALIVIDAIGGTSEKAHRTGVERVVHAGAQPVTWVALAVELQRDWAREETVADVIEIVLTERLLKE